MWVHQHLHLPHKPAPPSVADQGIRKGWMGIRVGGEGEEQQRFVVPVDYLTHPLFVGLLKAAEEEYGFDHQGAITIPCHVDYFRRLQSIIDRDCHAGTGAAAAEHQYHHFHFCFRARVASCRRRD